MTLQYITLHTQDLVRKIVCHQRGISPKLSEHTYSHIISLHYIIPAIPKRAQHRAQQEYIKSRYPARRKRKTPNAQRSENFTWKKTTETCLKLCTAKLCLEKQNKTYRDQSYPKAFPQIHKRESNFPCSLAQITPDNKQRFNTHSVSLARAWANECRWVFSSNTVQRWQKPRRGFCLNCKLDSSLDEIPKSDPLRIKTFHSVLKLLKCFQTVQIMFSFLQKHHNSQLQNETSATAASVVLVECHKMIYAS